MEDQTNQPQPSPEAEHIADQYEKVLTALDNAAASFDKPVNPAPQYVQIVQGPAPRPVVLNASKATLKAMAVYRTEVERAEKTEDKTEQIRIMAAAVAAFSDSHTAEELFDLPVPAFVAVNKALGKLLEGESPN